jgi:secondary thiamine-phosphate synthase enzyme
MVFQTQLRFSTDGRGTYNISKQIDEAITKSGIKTGICQIFIQHTSASLIMCENADPTVRTDLETFMKRLVPDGDAMFKHQDEGPDDMPAHVRTMLSGNSLSIPVRKGKSDLGMWQGVFLWEHRTHRHKRNVSVTLIGE